MKLTTKRFKKKNRLIRIHVKKHLHVPSVGVFATRRDGYSGVLLWVNADGTVTPGYEDVDDLKRMGFKVDGGTVKVRE